MSEKNWDLVSLLDTLRGNQYLLMAEDSFSRNCHAYPIPNKEGFTVAKVLMDEHFNIYGSQISCTQITVKNSLIICVENCSPS